jgi:phosphate transport system substrate-binding protein
LSSPKKRRVLAFAAAVVSLSLVAGACGDDSGSSSSTTTKATGTTVAGATTTAVKVAVKGSLTGSGATFPKAFYDEAITAFKKANPGVSDITYPGGGSGKGRTDLQGQLNDFSGSDSPVTKAEDLATYKGGEILHFPTVVAPITVSYNLDGVDKLNLSADTVAKIFSRTIKTWDDAAIVAENPDSKAKLTGAITVAHRSDSSGTTDNFTKFLVAGAPTTWTLKSGSTIEWPADTQAGSGNPGVAQIVKGTKGAVGYVDYSDAKASGLKFASIKNKAGKYVAPSIEGASAAAAGVTADDKLVYSPVWADGDAAYPIAAATWILVYSKQTSREKGLLVKEFLRYILTDGQKLAPTVDFAPLPTGIDTKAIAQLDKIQIPAA